MKKFIKKPVVIEAEQWLGTEEQKERLLASGVIIDIPSRDGSCLIPTLEGNMECSINDWIIKGIKGEYYPCKPDIFELTYDFVESEEVEVPSIGMTYEEAEVAMGKGSFVALPEWGGFWFFDSKTEKVIVLTKEGKITDTPFDEFKERNDWIVVVPTKAQQKIVSAYFSPVEKK